MVCNGCCLVNDVIIAGGGAAGLAAMRALLRKGLRVLLLEARPRVGGRMLTVAGAIAGSGLELGAEFIHGKSNALWPLIEQAGLRVKKGGDRHWRFENGSIREQKGFWDQLDQLLQKVHPRKDEPFSKFLEQHPGIDPALRQIATDYVEGFFAGDKDRFSTKALLDEQDNEVFRIENGYRSLIDWFTSEIARENATLCLGVRVTRIAWKRHHVEIHALEGTQRKLFYGKRAIITIPPSVLRSRGEGAVKFQPALPARFRHALSKSAMGDVTKVILQFRKNFWPQKGLGFIHVPGACFPTWWWIEASQAWVGWVGGPRARKMNELADTELMREAIITLSEFFGKSEKLARENCIGFFRHNWTRDPFSRGAYSYPAVDTADVPQQLSTPINDTIFFAGEATAKSGQEGTVHGAIASGLRAVRQMKH